MNDVAFDGGTGKGHHLALGSNSFIPGFEEQLINCKVNDDKNVKVNFPENYNNKDLGGKEAIFDC